MKLRSTRLFAGLDHLTTDWAWPVWLATKHRMIVRAHLPGVAFL